MSNSPFRFCSAVRLVIANALDEVGAMPLLRDLRVKPADPALRPLPAVAAARVVHIMRVRHRREVYR